MKFQPFVSLSWSFSIYYWVKFIGLLLFGGKLGLIFFYSIGFISSNIFFNTFSCCASAPSLLLIGLSGKVDLARAFSTITFLCALRPTFMASFFLTYFWRSKYLLRSSGKRFILTCCFGSRPPRNLSKCLNFSGLSSIYI